jgi:protocatechuate 3,4-dioxygenase beta subunit
MKWKSLAAALVLALLSIGAMAADKKDKEDANTRSVQGTVSDNAGGPVNGAVVQIKNTKTLQIRSFITKENGSYYFHGLSPDVDYEIKADFQGASSSAKTLSSFDSRKDATINLKLNKK